MKLREACWFILKGPSCCVVVCYTKCIFSLLTDELSFYLIQRNASVSFKCMPVWKSNGFNPAAWFCCFCTPLVLPVLLITLVPSPPPPTSSKTEHAVKLMSVPLNLIAPNVTAVKVGAQHAEQTNCPCSVCFHVGSHRQMPAGRKGKGWALF